MSKGTLDKGRSRRTYDNKMRRITKKWNHCPKLQKRITLKDFLDKIKKPNEDRKPKRTTKG